MDMDDPGCVINCSIGICIEEKMIIPFSIFLATLKKKLCKTVSHHIIFFTSRTISEGLFATVIPAFSNAWIFSSAVPTPIEMMAPA